MTTFKFRAKSAGGHIHLLVYVGPDISHLAYSGKLVFGPKEYRDFVLRVLGAEGMSEVDAWETRRGAEVHDWVKVTP